MKWWKMLLLGWWYVTSFMTGWVRGNTVMFSLFVLTFGAHAVLWFRGVAENFHEGAEATGDDADATPDQRNSRSADSPR